MMRRGGRRRRFGGCLINSGIRNRNKKLSISFSISARHGNSRFLITHDDHTSRATTPFCPFPENPNPNSFQKAVWTVSESEKKMQKRNFQRERTFRDLLPQYWLLNLVAFSDSKLRILEVMNFCEVEKLKWEVGLKNWIKLKWTVENHGWIYELALLDW